MKKLIFILMIAFLCTTSVYASSNQNIFVGEGSKKNPFILTTEKDLVAFAEQVNNGNHFKNQYFSQSADIDLSGIDWTPIGEFGTPNYFDGSYDGNGYCIKNITITDKGNCGFFGQLGGTVMNLGIESGEMIGACVGGITSHSASENASIINCYSKAKIQGLRAGGIADNFNGSIIGCWSSCQLTGEQTGNIVSFGARYVKFCYDKIPTAKEINHNLILVANATGISYQDLNLWKQSGESLSFSGLKKSFAVTDVFTILLSNFQYILLAVFTLFVGFEIIVIVIKTDRQNTIEQNNLY